MKKTFLKTIGCAAFTILMLVMLVPICASAQSKGIEGVWNSQLTRRNCETGAVIRTFSAMQMFNRGGTMQDTPVASPATNTPGYGVWSFESQGNYTAALQILRFNADGTFAGKGIIRQQITLSESGDSYTATLTSQVLDVNGNVVGGNCFTAEGTRFE